MFSMKKILLLPRFLDRKVLDFLTVFDVNSVDRLFLLGDREKKIYDKVFITSNYYIDEILNSQAYFLPLDERDYALYDSMVASKKFVNLTLIGPRNYQNLISKNYLYNIKSKTLPLAPPFCLNDSVDTQYIAKADTGSGSRDISKINYYSAKYIDKKSYCVQKFIESKFEPRGYSGFIDKKGKITSYTHQRILTRKSLGGVSLFAKQIACDEKLKLKCDNFLQMENYHGFFMFEYIVDTEGEYQIIELNSRLWGSFKLGVMRIQLNNDDLEIKLSKKRSIFIYVLAFKHNFVASLKHTIACLCNYRIVLSPSPRLIVHWYKVYANRAR